MKKEDKLDAMNKINLYCIKYNNVIDKGISIRLKHYTHALYSNCANCGYKKIEMLVGSI